MSDEQPEDLTRQLRKLVAKHGLQRVADAVPTHRHTLYRLMRGDTSRPTHSVRAGIIRLVKQEKPNHGSDPNA
jgi:DNA-binding phage protein